MAMQRLGTILEDVLEELAIDARELALAGEFERGRKGSGRDWLAVSEQLRRMTIRQGGGMPNRRERCAGELYMVKG